MSEMYKELTKSLVKEKLRIIDIDKMLSYVEDVLQYLENNESNDYEINQEIIGMLKLFQEYIVKVWKEVNVSQNNYCKLSKTLVLYIIKYYYICYKCQSRVFNNAKIEKKGTQIV